MFSDALERVDIKTLKVSVNIRDTRESTKMQVKFLAKVSKNQRFFPSKTVLNSFEACEGQCT